MSAASSRGRAPQSVAVLGSCVTRDNFNSIFNPGYKKFFDVRLSANQSSVIALMSPPIITDFTPLREMSDYDQWNIGSDLSRDFLPQLAELQPDLLILDFFGDVHFGVARLPDGRYLTNNRWKTQHTDFYATHRDAGDLTIIKHADDADAYFALWTEAMDRLADYLHRTCPETTVIVHRGYNTGEVLVPDRPRPIPLRRLKKGAKLDVAGSNAFWDRLDDYAIETYGWPSIDLRDLRAPSFLEHPWGAFYVHYTTDYYHRFLAELHKIALRGLVDPEVYERIVLIEAAAPEPVERRLAVERAAFERQRDRLRRARAEVERLESLGPFAAARSALGRWRRARVERGGRRADS